MEGGLIKADEITISQQVFHIFVPEDLYVGVLRGKNILLRKMIPVSEYEITLNVEG